MTRSSWLVAAVFLMACRSSEPSGDAAWLSGSVDRRFELVAKHLRGFDVAMLETGHRYAELYWAGRDANWQYARYQVDKIETAVDNGVERRPKRAQSAKMLDGALGPLREAIAAGDSARFGRAFEELTRTCNACHRAEQVEFVQVRPPDVRCSPVKLGGSAP